MGSVVCCENSHRVDTLKFDEIDSSSQASNQQKKDDQFSPKVSSPCQETIPLQINKTNPNFYQKNPCISNTLQSQSFKTLSSEQHYSNFVTFQAIPSSRDYQSSKIQTIKTNLLDGFNEIQHQMSCDFQCSDYIKLPSNQQKII